MSRERGRAEPPAGPDTGDRLAVWSPVPPQQTGVAEFSAQVMAGLAEFAEVAAVVPESVISTATPPAGVRLVTPSEYARCPEAFSLNIYHMGNNPLYHSYMHQQILDSPGILVLHDPALVDFYHVLFGGTETLGFLEEAAFNGCPPGELPRVEVDGREEIDRLRLLMCRRLVESSRAVVVHSAWASRELSARFQVPCIQHIPLPVPDLPVASPPDPRSDAVTFGVFGAFAGHKRLATVLAAFEQLHAEMPRTRLLLVGWGAKGRMQADWVSRHPGVVARHDVDGAELLTLMDQCEAVLSLRWPTAGESSGVLAQAFGLGKPVIVSDLPQFAEHDAAYCWRVPVDPALELPALLTAMRRVASDPAAAYRAGQRARDDARKNALLTTVCAQYLELIRACTPDEAGAPRAGSERARVNLIGDWAAATGLAEAGRRAAVALLGGDVDAAVVDIRVPDVPRAEDRIPPQLRGRPTARIHDLDVFFLNINELHVLDEAYLRPADRANYVIGSWFWELPRVARSLVTQIGRVDEIWAGSEFIADVFRGYTPAPVNVMPCVVEPESDGILARSDFGLPDKDCLFLFHFDANSTLARKNPWAVIKAFKTAFTRNDSARLVMKVLHATGSPEAAEQLRREVAEVDGILVEDELSHKEMASLVSLCDAYVSLHRAEGFGLGLAEAMYFERPVVATAYSGNLDFTTPENSCLVGYRLRPIDHRDMRYNKGMAQIYEEGQLWAEPDVQQAARWMRLLYEDLPLRTRLGREAAKTIRSKYSGAAARTAMTRRIGDIQKSRWVAPAGNGA